MESSLGKERREAVEEIKFQKNNENNDTICSDAFLQFSTFRENILFTCLKTLVKVRFLICQDIFTPSLGPKQI
jgi:hypothetical protein